MHAHLAQAHAPTHSHTATHRHAPTPTPTHTPPHLAHIVIGVALQLDGDALAQPRAQRLAGVAAQLHMDGVVRQAGGAKALGDLGCEAPTARQGE